MYKIFLYLSSTFQVNVCYTFGAINHTIAQCIQTHEKRERKRTYQQTRKFVERGTKNEIQTVPSYLRRMLETYQQTRFTHKVVQRTTQIATFDTTEIRRINC